MLTYSSLTTPLASYACYIYRYIFKITSYKFFSYFVELICIFQIKKKTPSKSKNSSLLAVHKTVAFRDDNLCLDCPILSIFVTRLPFYLFVFRQHNMHFI